jgi:hypothetical protein
MTPTTATPTREALLHMLYEAAELEHNLMCTYLYAAFSLKSDDEGLQPDKGDVIVGLDGLCIDSMDSLHQALGSSRVGRDCLFKILRGASSPQVKYITVRPSERPS